MMVTKLKQHPTPKTQKTTRRWWYLEPEKTTYRFIWDLQQKIVAARNEGRLDTNILMLLEHTPVFTMGRRGGLKNLTVSETFLKQKGIDIVHIERGGDITYHGPGQLVGYPIIHLPTCQLSVVKYINILEQIMIRAAAEFGIKAQVDDRNRGVWVDGSKLGSIGIAVRKGVSFHGFALNVNTDLTPFEWVNPCGLEGVGITSLANEKRQSVPMADVRTTICNIFKETLNLHLDPITMAQLKQYIETTAAKRSHQ